MKTVKKAAKKSNISIQANTVNVKGSYPSDKPYVPSEERKSGWDDWQIRDALDTLAKAIKIRKNAAFMKVIRQKALEMQKIATETTKAL